VATKMKNKLYKLKTPCPKCQGPVIYNQTHHLRYCRCTAPEKVEIVQTELDRDWRIAQKYNSISELLQVQTLPNKESRMEEKE
jgi:hypothetical protein